MKRDRYIRVPKDSKAAEDYDYGVQKKSQMIEWILGEDEYKKLEKLNVFETLNNNCNIIIDDFEEEVIECENLEKALCTINKILKRENIEKESVLMLKKIENMIIYAIEKGTLIAFDF